MNFLKYHKLYEDKVFTYFYYNLSSEKEIAEDLTSETFLKALKSFSKFDSNKEFSAWIFRIARNTLYDYYRTKKKDIAFDDVSISQLQDFFSYEVDIGQKIDNENKIIDFTQALEKLTPSEKEAIILKYIDDFSNKEIAKKTNNSYENTRKILSRGLKKIRNLLQ